MVNQAPSVRPADESSLAGVLKTAIRKEMQSFDGMMPVEVVSYDRAKNRAVVKHLIQMQGSDGEKVSRAQVASVRVHQPGNAAFSMSLPIKPGDKGWLLAADRDISIFQQGLKEDAPNTDRMHSFQDGLFMPDAMTMGDVQPADSDAVVIGTLDGSARISMLGDTITLTVGGVSMAISAAGIAITGGTVTHNGKNIGSAHVHTGVVPGGGNTGAPA